MAEAEGAKPGEELDPGMQRDGAGHRARVPLEACGLSSELGGSHGGLCAGRAWPDVGFRRIPLAGVDPGLEGVRAKPGRASR